jgi:hypothetical protein
MEWNKWQFCRELPYHGLGIHRKNAYSPVNYQLIDEESTRRKVIPLGITTGRMEIPREFTSSQLRNPTEEWDSAGNDQLTADDSDRHDQNFRASNSKSSISF